MPKGKEKKTQYGIQITKPFSNEMYDHNDDIALELRRNIISEIDIAYSAAKNEDGDYEIDGEAPAEKKLRKIGSAIEGMGYGDGYGIDEIKDNIVNELANIANWRLHEEYGYLCSEGIVPKIAQKMVGFDKAEDGCWDCYWTENAESVTS